MYLAIQRILYQGKLANTCFRIFTFIFVI